MAATDCALRAVLRPGDHVVIPDDAYGGAFRLIDKVFSQWNVTHTPVPLSDLDAVRSGADPAHPDDLGGDPDQPALLSVADIAAIVQIASSAGERRAGRRRSASTARAVAAAAGADISTHLPPTGAHHGTLGTW